jgi:hypothetical protein
MCRMEYTNAYTGETKTEIPITIYDYPMNDDEYEAAHRHGYKKGYIRGYDDGYDHGYDAGYAQGIYTGMIVGVISLLASTVIMATSRRT